MWCHLLGNLGFELEGGLHEGFEPFRALNYKATFKGFILPIGIEALMQLLHVGELAITINAAHLHEVLSLVVKVTHDILQCVSAHT